MHIHTKLVDRHKLVKIRSFIWKHVQEVFDDWVSFSVLSSKDNREKTLNGHREEKPNEPEDIRVWKPFWYTGSSYRCENDNWHTLCKQVQLREDDTASRKAQNSGKAATLNRKSRARDSYILFAIRYQRQLRHAFMRKIKSREVEWERCQSRHVTSRQGLNQVATTNIAGIR